jgi:hypothetical protein
MPLVAESVQARRAAKRTQPGSKKHDGPRKGGPSRREVKSPGVLGDLTVADGAGYALSLRLECDLALGSRGRLATWPVSAWANARMLHSKPRDPSPRPADPERRGSGATTPARYIGRDGMDLKSICSGSPLRFMPD